MPATISCTAAATSPADESSQPSPILKVTV
uniref:Uncharacterized protein n=1 Tax=Arundo donax TaxID=35708 RepID=A0A0A8YI32_ARUDO